MEMKNKHIFWEALIIAIFLFASGILLGYLLEMNRTDKIISLYQESELDLSDISVQNNMLSFNNLNCDEAAKQTIAFADRVYGEARLLDEYESSSKLSEGIVFQHKRYDLLRTILWTNAIQLKAKCGAKFDTLVYFYQYLPNDINVKSMQMVFSDKLAEIKNQFGNEIILIPIAGNLGVNSIDYLMRVYNINSMPTILINEKTKIDSLDSLKEIAVKLG